MKPLALILSLALTGCEFPKGYTVSVFASYGSGKHRIEIGETLTPNDGKRVVPAK